MDSTQYAKRVDVYKPLKIRELSERSRFSLLFSVA